jgi:hypothetical protein
MHNRGLRKAAITKSEHYPTGPLRNTASNNKT